MGPNNVYNDNAMHVDSITNLWRKTRASFEWVGLWYLYFYPYLGIKITPTICTFDNYLVHSLSTVKTVFDFSISNSPPFFIYLSIQNTYVYTDNLSK